MDSPIPCPPFVHVIFILDGSGSMNRYKENVKRAYETFIRTLQECKGAEISVSLIEFTHGQRVVFKGVQIQDAPHINWYDPTSGYDTIYDSVLAAISLGERTKRGNSKTVVVMQADGGDNASKTNRVKCADVVSKKLAEGNWEFNYLACGTDYMTGEQMARNVGFPVENVISFDIGNSSGVASAYEATAQNIAKFVTGRATDTAYTQAQKKKIEK